MKNFNKKYQEFQDSISRPKHIVGLILAVGLALTNVYFKETLEDIHTIIYRVLYVFSIMWSIFHLQGLKLFKGPLN